MPAKPTKAASKKKAPAKKAKKNGPPQSPRGMRDIMGEEYYAYHGFYERAEEIAIYYGFQPIEPPIVEEEELFLRGVGEGTDIVEKELYNMRTKGGHRLAMRPEPTAGIMRAYLEHGMQAMPQPVSFYTYGNFYRHEKPQKGRYRELRQFGLEMLGTEKSIGDAMIIKLVMTILDDVGMEDLSLELNSIGDKECRSNYRRELVSYYKKHLGKLCKDCVRRFKDNPLRLLDCKEEGCSEIKAEAPTPVSFLCEPCKKHFKEVLEYLEALGIEYNINNNLVRGLDYYTRTVFEVFTSTIDPLTVPRKKKVAEPEEVDPDANAETNANAEGEGDEQKVAKEEIAPEPEPEPEAKPQPSPLAIAGGGRYDYLAKTIGSNKLVPAVGAGIGVDRVLQLMPAAARKKLSPRVVKKPKIFFIQLGFEAKLKSMVVTEILRKAKIPVNHSISKDSLGSQLAIAEKLGVPYTIILGQREVIDDTVIVRTMSTRSQKTIPIADLAAYIKTIK